MAATPTLISLLACAVALYAIKGVVHSLGASRRQKFVPIHEEHVLVIGASSGVGKEIALQYARRGARVALVGRRAEDLERVLQECVSASPHRGSSVGVDLVTECVQRESGAGAGEFWGFTPIGSTKFDTRCFYAVADCSDPGAIYRVKTDVEESMCHCQHV